MYAYLAAALAISAASAFSAWQIQDWRYGAKEADRLEQAREDKARKEKTIDVAAVGHEKDKVQIRTEWLTINKETERVVKEPYYVDRPCLNDDGLQLIAAAIRGPTTPSEPAPAVPRPDTAK